MDDSAGPLIRSTHEERKHKFMEAYDTWAKANRAFVDSFSRRYSGFLTRNLFNRLEEAWDEYCLARDEWAGKDEWSAR